MVHKFWTEYKPDPNDAGKLKAIDKVAYGPIAGVNRSVNVCKVSDLSRLQPLEGSQNPAVVLAHERWAAIEPAYKAWKSGQEMPLDGTPLAAFNAISAEQAELFRSRGIKTVEALASMTESSMAQIQVPNLRSLIQQAKNFLDASEQSRLAGKLSEKDTQIQNLEADRDELKSQVAGLMQKVEQLAAMAAAKLDDEETPKKKSKAA